MGPTYIDAEMEIQKAREKYLLSLPKLPIGNQLEKTLPRILKLLSKDDYDTNDLSPCSAPVKSMVGLLVLHGYKNGKYVTPDKEERERIHNALNFLAKAGCYRMLQEYHLTIAKIMKMNIFWIRDIDGWSKKSHNTYKQVKSLIEHLFCQFQVPEFMFQAWTDKAEEFKHVEWFLQITEGKSARELYKFPILATRKIAHSFINTPFPGYSIDDAVRRAQIVGLGGSPRLADAILMSRLRNNFSNNAFWETVFNFFINTPMLNLDEVGTVIDYINQMKFVQQHHIVNGVRVFGPLMPGFSMRGRNMATLIEATHAWHKELGKESKLDLTATWNASGIRPYIIEEGNKERLVKRYEIFELVSAKDLHAEGKSMHHCVFSYLRSCISKSCCIFSLRLNDERLATIEVRGNSIVQVRGSHNKRVTDKAATLISNWAYEERLDITGYAFGRF
jgi:hypothetical protein